jgi:hypothetical protein
MDQIGDTITAYMRELIDDLNNNHLANNPGTSSNSTNKTRNYNTFMLRTTLCLAYVWVNYVAPNVPQFQAGGGGHGALIDHLSNVPLNAINSDFLASTIFDYNPSPIPPEPMEIKVKTFYDTNIQFAKNEASMICRIDEIAKSDTYRTRLSMLRNYSYWSSSTMINPAWRIPAIDLNDRFKNNMGSLSYQVGLIIYHAHLDPVVSIDPDPPNDDGDPLPPLPPQPPQPPGDVGGPQLPPPQQKRDRPDTAPSASSHPLSAAATPTADARASPAAWLAASSDSASSDSASSDSASARAAPAAPAAVPARAPVWPPPWPTDTINTINTINPMNIINTRNTRPQTGAQKFGKRRGVITINTKHHKSIKHKSRKHKSKKSRKHKSRKHKSII